MGLSGSADFIFNFPSSLKGAPAQGYFGSASIDFHFFVSPLRFRLTTKKCHSFKGSKFPLV